MAEQPCDLDLIQEIYFKVVEASPDAKIVIDSFGVVVVFNVQAELMFGYDRSEVIGKTIEMLIPEDRRAIHGQHREGYYDEPKTREMGTGLALKGLHRSGKQFTVQIKLAPLIIPRSGIYTLAVVRRVKQP